MKTFKLISLQIIENGNLMEIDLVDGLIINQENDRRTWLLEAFISKTHDEYFKQLIQRNEDLEVQAVITRKENTPAPFEVKISMIKYLKDHISVLFEGKLKKTKSDYAETVLKALIDQGLSGENLLNEFKKRIRGESKLTAAKK